MEVATGLGAPATVIAEKVPRAQMETGRQRIRARPIMLSANVGEHWSQDMTSPQTARGLAEAASLFHAIASARNTNITAENSYALDRFTMGDGCASQLTGLNFMRQCPQPCCAGRAGCLTYPQLPTGLRLQLQLSTGRAGMASGEGSPRKEYRGLQRLPSDFTESWGASRFRPQHRPLASAKHTRPLNEAFNASAICSGVS